MEYEKQILLPLVTLYRLKYTPMIYDYGLCHISRHLPKDIIIIIEKLYKVNSFKDIENNIKIVLDLLDSFNKNML